MRLLALSAAPLSVPLLDPFTIATARVDATRAALIEVVLSSDDGRTATGLGEAATLLPVTALDQPELLALLSQTLPRLQDAAFTDRAALSALLDAHFDDAVARAGVESAVVDAWAQLDGVPLCTWLAAGAPPRTLTTDITVPIGRPEHMATLARGHADAGFTLFKVKVGKSASDDLAALVAIAARVPGARFVLDANCGFTADEALSLLTDARSQGLTIDCFEQPCARDDLTGMAQVTAHSDGVPVIADESVRTLAELDAVIAAGAAHGVNLKLAKSGGPLHALAIGQRAQQHGMPIMCGGMVETRLGMATMGHVACALGGVQFVDLDTALLLAEDPFDGGYVASGAQLAFGGAAGHGVRRRA